MASSCSAREERSGANQGRESGFARGEAKWSAMWPRRRTAPAIGTVQGRSEVGDGVGGSFVNRQSFRCSTIKQGFL